MVVGSIAPQTGEAVVDVLAICHQPSCWLLYVHTIDVRHNAEHTEVEISKNCARKPAQRILDLQVGVPPTSLCVGARGRKSSQRAAGCA